MEIKRYETSQAQAWDDLVLKSKNGIFLFERDYLDYHNDRFVDHSLVISKNEKVIALFPANQNGEEIYSHGGLTFGSLIMSFDLKATETLEIFILIKEYYSNLGFKKIIYKAIPSIFHKYPSEEDSSLIKAKAEEVPILLTPILIIFSASSGVLTPPAAFTGSFPALLSIMVTPSKVAGAHCPFIK